MIVTRQKKLDDRLIKDLLITAVEGGSGYWATFTHVARNRDVEDREGYLDVTFVELETIDEDFPCYIGLAQMREGIDRLVRLAAVHEHYGKHIDDLIEENWDAETADIILQLAVMGEIVYG